MFSYLLDKIKAAEFSEIPFQHIEIKNIFLREHLDEILSSPEINVAGLSSDEQLFRSLFDLGYKIIDFPGCIQDRTNYIRWHRNKEKSSITNTACEGFGMTVRMAAASTPIIQSLIEFVSGDAFQDALAEKYGIRRDDVVYDCGIQKYLDGYEISPHPDIRKKALTYMVNINPGADSEAQDHHTHYLQLKDKYKYVQSFWAGNPKQERCWVPWDWCESIKIQNLNNSMVIFSPSSDTMHAVKANYDHLASQRTQIYGNFWYHRVPIEAEPRWEDLEIQARRPEVAFWRRTVKAVLPAQAVQFVMERRRKDQFLHNRFE